VALPGRGTTFLREAGDPDARHVFVLLHGWTATAALNWFAAFRPLADLGRVLALDHRGHGDGIRSRERFRLEDCADDVAALCGRLGIERVIAVGYSMGGPIAQLLWRRHRGLVEGLVLCATARDFVGGRRRALALQGVGTGARFAAIAAPPGVRDRITERMLVARFDDDPLGRWARAEMRRNDLRALVEAGTALGAFTSRDWIGTVDVPTAVVVTRRDLVVPPVRQRRLAVSIPGATLHPVDGGHDVCAVAPERFVPALVDACTSVVGRCARALTAG
jgi:3-oxoadipate enol-lactonase